VKVDGRVVTELGTKADPAVSEICVDGRAIRLPAAKTYLVLNKPRGVICTCSDPRGRTTVVDLVPERFRARVFPVGRLDADSEGLLLLTDDGELAQRLTHPRFGVLKIYEVVVRGDMRRETLARLRRGLLLDEGQVVPARVEIAQRKRGRTRLHVALREGHKREIRRLMERVGHPVIRLIRRQIGPLKLGDLRPGAFRRLSRSEVAALRGAARPESTGHDNA